MAWEPEGRQNPIVLHHCEGGGLLPETFAVHIGGSSTSLPLKTTLFACNSLILTSLLPPAGFVMAQPVVLSSVGGPWAPL